MTIPVIQMTEGEASEATKLRDASEAITASIERLEKEERDNQAKLDRLLHGVAIKNNAEYRERYGKGENTIYFSTRLVPTLSEDGQFVVLIQKQSH